MEDVDTIWYENKMSNFTETPILTTHQIIQLIWTPICLLPIGILLHILLKHSLHKRNNFHFVILHWTIANLILVLGVIPEAVIPEIYWTRRFLEIYFVIDLILRFFPIAIGTAFIFDNFITSKVFCRYFVYTIWGVLIIIQIMSLICIYYNIGMIYGLLSLTFMTTKPLFIIIFIVKCILFCVKGSEEVNCRLRLLIAGVYILIGSFQWLLINMAVAETHVGQIQGHLMMMAFLGNGLINLILLVRYDLVIRMHFNGIFLCSDQYTSVLYSQQEPNIVSISNQNELTHVV